MIRALKNRLRARRIASWGWGRTWSPDELRELKGSVPVTTAEQRAQLRVMLHTGDPGEHGDENVASAMSYSDAPPWVREFTEKLLALPPGTLIVANMPRQW